MSDFDKMKKQNDDKNQSSKSNFSNKKQEWNKNYYNVILNVEFKTYYVECDIIHVYICTVDMWNFIGWMGHAPI